MERNYNITIIFIKVIIGDQADGHKTYRANQLVTLVNFSSKTSYQDFLERLLNYWQ